MLLITKKLSIKIEIINILIEKQYVFASEILNLFLFFPKMEVWSLSVSGNLAAVLSCTSSKSISLIKSPSSKLTSSRKFSHLKYNIFVVFSDRSRNDESIIYFVMIVRANRKVSTIAKKIIIMMEAIKILRLPSLTSTRLSKLSTTTSLYRSNNVLQ